MILVSASYFGSTILNLMLTYSLLKTCRLFSLETNVSSWTLPHLAIKHWVKKIPHRAAIAIIQKTSVRRASATYKQIIRPLTIYISHLKQINFVRFIIRCFGRKRGRKLQITWLTVFWSSTHQQVQLVQWQESQLRWQQHLLERNKERYSLVNHSWHIQKSVMKAISGIWLVKLLACIQYIIYTVYWKGKSNCSWVKKLFFSHTAAQKCIRHA